MSGSFSAPLSVLIIDDDPHFLAAYTVLFEEKFQVYTATTGEAGLAHLQREPIDLLLLDAYLSCGAW